jgi:hypothetical protein
MHGARASLGAQLVARVIDENSPHQLRRDREEVGTVLPVGVALIDQLEVRLVDDGRRLQTIGPPLASEMPRCDRAKLVMHERNQLVEGFLAAVAPLLEESRDFRRRQGSFIQCL